MDEPNSERVSPSRRRRVARIAAWSVAGLAVGIVLVVAIGAWLLGRETTLQRIVARAEEVLNGQLKVEGVSGSLYDHVAFDRLVFRTATQVVTLEKGSLRYRLEPFERRFTISAARAAKLTIETIARSDEPVAAPDTMELPAGLRIDTLRLDAVHLDAIEIVDGQRKTVLTAADLRARYGSEGGIKRWTVERAAVATPWGVASGAATLDAGKPFRIAAQVLLDGRYADVPHQVTLRAPLVVEGALGDLQITTEFTISDPANAPLAGHAEAHVLPFRDQPIASAKLHVAGVSPKRWNAALPEADISVDASITPLPNRLASGGADPFTGVLRAVNAMPGAIDRGRIPVASVTAEVTGDSIALAVSQVQADLGAAGQLSGRGAYAFAGGGTPSFEGEVHALDLRALDGRLIASRFNGPVAVSRSAGIVHLDTTLADTDREVTLRGEVEGPQIRVAQADVRVGGSRVAASGHVTLDRDRPFELTGVATHLNPRDFGEFAKADLNGAFKVGGTLGGTGTSSSSRDLPSFHVAADVRIAPSRVFDRPLEGTIVGAVDGAVADPASKGSRPVALHRIIGARVALSMGADHLALDGDFGRPEDRLRWKVDAGRLADLNVGLSGSLKGDGVVGGTLAEPVVDFALTGDDLHYAVTGPKASAAPATRVFSLKSLRGTGRLLAGPTGRLDADVAITAFRDGDVGPPLVQSARVLVEGTRDAHRLTIVAASDRFDFTAVADGGLDAANIWRGDVTRLESRGKLPFVLAGTMPLVAGAERIEVGAAHLAFGEGEVDVERLSYVDGKLMTAGKARGFPLSVIGTFSRDFNARVATSLKFGGGWDLRIGDTIDGRIRVYRESGNVRFLTEPRIDVDPEKLAVDATIVADRITAQVAATGRGLGNVQGSIETRFSKRDGQWGIAGDAPLAVSSDIDIPDLRWIARLSGVPGLDVEGGVKLAVRGTGTVGHPALAGHATGDAIGLRWPDQGVHARDGHIDLDFEGDRVILKQATLAAGDGHLDAHGDLRLEDRNLAGTLAIKFDKFEAVSRTDRTMVISGNGSMRFGASGLDVTAEVKADRGSLQLAERRGPVMSTDIVIVGREQDDDIGPVLPATRVRFDVKFDMGDDFKVKGAGFDGKLGGAIRIAGVGTDLRAIGTVAVREGTYEGYGQRLTIDRGNLVFSGPIDNPALDIVAIRKNLAVEAGVQISGTALAPQAKLTSTPNVPDTEKLSWLVLGHGLAASNKSDYALLTSAAAGLLGSSDSASIQSRIAATLGVDEIGVSGIGGDKGGLLTVGKQISSRLKLTFEQGFTKAATLIKARYNVYQHIDLQVQTGTESAVDIFYTFSFD